MRELMLYVEKENECYCEYCGEAIRSKDDVVLYESNVFHADCFDVMIEETNK